MNAATVAVLDSIHDIDAAEWDALVAPGDLLSTHRFVAVCEAAQIPGATLRYVTARQNGRLTGWACVTRMEVALAMLAPPAIRKPLGWLGLRLTVLFCGLPVSFGTSAVAGAWQQLIAPIEALAARDGIGLICWKEFAEPVTLPGYFAARSLPGATLPLPWLSFEGYAGAMRAGYRRQLGRDLAQGLTVRRDYDPALLHRLYAEVIARAEHRLEELPPAFFTGLARLDPVALIVERAGRPVASAILLHAPGRTIFLLAGLDYAAEAAQPAYPFLMAQVVAEAIRAGARSLELGQTSYPLKSRFGAEFSDRTIYLKHRGPLRHRLLRWAAPLLFPRTRLPRRRVFRGAT